VSTTNTPIQAGPHRTVGTRDGTDAAAACARYLLARLTVAAILFVPLAALSAMYVAEPHTRFAGWQWMLVALTLPIVTWSAWPFHRIAIRNVRRRSSSMETSASVSVTAATIFALYTAFGDRRPVQGKGIWEALLGSEGICFEVAAGVTVVVLAQKYLEARVKSKLGAALRTLAAQRVNDVTVVGPDGSETSISAAELRERQRFSVRTGQTIATDGLVVDGSATLDMRASTGEANPKRVAPGACVNGGTAVIDGSLIVEAVAASKDAEFADIVHMIEYVGTQKSNAQRIADRIASVFVPFVLTVAALTTLESLLAEGQLTQAFSAALAVLVVTCPCALGLASPTAMMLAMSRGAQLGIFFKSYQSVEAARAVDTVVFGETDGEPGELKAHDRRIRTVLVTAGMRDSTAPAGFDEVFADISPEGKEGVITRLHDRGCVVAVLGDSVSDASALVRADLGMAVGSGADVAIAAADIILFRADIDGVRLTLDLAAATMRTVRRNMVWALGYNVIAIPVAVAGFLNPLAATAAMAASALFVALNSLRLSNFGDANRSASRRALGRLTEPWGELLTISRWMRKR
jgi:cation transport ATPase